MITFSSIYHRRGHGIHSPFVYNMIRGAFLPKTVLGDTRLYEQLKCVGVGEKLARQLCNVYGYCGFSEFELVTQPKTDFKAPDKGVVIVVQGKKMVVDPKFIEQVMGCDCAIAILYPRRSMGSFRIWRRFVDEGHSLTIDKREFFLIFNNKGLQRQHFKL